MRKNKYTFIDLFAGAGGLSCGLQQSGFTPCFVNEIVPTFCNTYKANHDLDDDQYYIGDINELNKHLDEYAKYIKGATPSATQVHAGELGFGRPLAPRGVAF